MVLGGILMSKISEIDWGNLPEYQPGDKLYQLFKHKQVIVKGQEEKLLIKIKKIS